MHVGRLIFREIAYRRLNFALGAMGIVVAVACLAAEVTLLRRHDMQTDAILAGKEKETREMMSQFEDDIRKITVKMGFNVLILPKGQSQTDLYDDQAKHLFMPEEYSQRLASSRMATINHVLPSLAMRVKWPECERKIMLVGTRGEVLIQSASQKPILEAVAPGNMVLGHELHRSLKLTVGRKVQLMGREFTVSKLMDERGNWDDVTVWIDLRTAQEMLGQQGKINAILALECNCSTDRLSKIRGEIGSLLPDTNVVEFASQAIGRAEARNRAAAQAVASLEHEKAGRQQLRAGLETFAAVLVPVAMLAAGTWVGLLIFGNVRERRAEIAVLRAMGLRSRQVFAIFVGKAAIMGLAGACAGYVGGVLAGAFWPGTAGMPSAGSLINVRLLAIIMALAPLLAILASWIPAMLAAREDPAVILQKE
ncbi:MAG: FtsX-like permease family protein [Tepidisphaeraceae bacterium]|jgi:ABC-type lipoprotein release transport system permease subunit